MSEMTPGPGASQARVSPREAARFFVELAETMQGLGYPANTAESAIRRIAAELRLELEVLVLQSVVLVEVRRDGTKDSAMRRLTPDFRYRLHLVRELDEILDSVTRGAMDIQAASAALSSIRSRPMRIPAPLFLVGSAVYAAAVAARLGGAWIEMTVAAFVALGFRAVGRSVRCTGAPTSTLVRTFIVGAVAALVTLLSASAGGAFDAPAALFGGVVLMVPSMVMTMAAHELGGNLLETGSMRLAYALLRFVMLAAGIAAGVRVWDFFGSVPETTAPGELPGWCTAAILVVGGAGLTISLEASYRDMPWVIGGVLLAVAAQKVSEAILGRADGAPLTSAFVVGIAGYLQARLPGHVAPTVLVPGLLQLVPGFLGTRAVFMLLSGEEPAQGETLLHALLVAVQLAMGLALASGLFRAWSARG